MGAHGPEIFDEDVAMDVRYSFTRAFAEFDDVAAATQAVLDEYAEYLEDEDDEVNVILALASLQLDRGPVEPSIRRRAIEIIDGQEDRERWFESTWPERERLLAIFRDQILDDATRPHRRLSESERRSALAPPGLRPGAWDPWISGNAIGWDVLRDADIAECKGLDDDDQIDFVLARYEEELADPASEADVYLALALYYLNRSEDSRRPRRIQDLAVAAIDGGDAIRAWQSTAPELLAERQKDLAEFRDRLIAAG